MSFASPRGGPPSPALALTADGPNFSNFPNATGALLGIFDRRGSSPSPTLPTSTLPNSPPGEETPATSFRLHDASMSLPCGEDPLTTASRQTNSNRRRTKLKHRVPLPCPRPSRPNCDRQAWEPLPTQRRPDRPSSRFGKSSKEPQQGKPRPILPCLFNPPFNPRCKSATDYSPVWRSPQPVPVDHPPC